MKQKYNRRKSRTYFYWMFKVFILMNWNNALVVWKNCCTGLLVYWAHWCRQRQACDLPQPRRSCAGRGSRQSARPSRRGWRASACSSWNRNNAGGKRNYCARRGSCCGNGRGNLSAPALSGWIPAPATWGWTTSPRGGAWLSQRWLQVQLCCPGHAKRLYVPHQGRDGRQQKNFCKKVGKLGTCPPGTERRDFSNPKIMPNRIL